MQEVSILIKVKDGMVQSIFANGKVKINAEVLDLDMPVDASQEELSEFDMKTARVRSVSNDPQWQSIY